MGIEISNSGPKIIFKNGTLTRHILKSCIREVTLLRGTILKIEISDQPLKNIYVDHANVTEPVSGSPGGLRNLILTMLESEELVVLNDLKTNSVEVEQFFEPTIVDDSLEGTTYKGYADIGHGLVDQPVWAIQRSTIAGGITINMWAEGTKDFDKVWDNRAAYSYS